MSDYKIFRAVEFDRDLRNLDNDLILRALKIESKLSINPYVGKSLSTKWLREKKVESYRIYYLIYEEFKIVYMVAISKKKNQQKVINTIRGFLEIYYTRIKNLI